MAQGYGALSREDPDDSVDRRQHRLLVEPGAVGENRKDDLLSALPYEISGEGVHVRDRPGLGENAPAQVEQPFLERRVDLTGLGHGGTIRIRVWPKGHVPQDLRDRTRGDQVVGGEARPVPCRDVQWIEPDV